MSRSSISEAERSTAAIIDPGVAIGCTRLCRRVFGGEGLQARRPGSSRRVSRVPVFGASAAQACSAFESPSTSSEIEGLRRIAAQPRDQPRSDLRRGPANGGRRRPQRSQSGGAPTARRARGVDTNLAAPRWSDHPPSRPSGHRRTPSRIERELPVFQRFVGVARPKRDPSSSLPFTQPPQGVLTGGAQCGQVHTCDVALDGLCVLDDVFQTLGGFFRRQGRGPYRSLFESAVCAPAPRRHPPCSPESRIAAARDRPSG